MQKIKAEVLKRMMNAKLSGIEVDFILYLSHLQDDSGLVTGVYYKAACEVAGFSHQSFYDALKMLKEKGIIHVKQNYYGDHDIRILHNDFTYPDALKEGYISTSQSIFRKKEFIRLKANEKLLVMYFLHITASAVNGKHHIGTDKLFETYTKLFGVSKRVIRKYLTSLRTFFSIGIKDHIYWITPLPGTFAKSRKTDKEIYAEHLGKGICRRFRIKDTEKKIKEFIDLIEQYFYVCKTELADLMIRAVTASLRRKNYYRLNTYKWKREISLKFVHKCLLEEIQGQTV